MPPSLCCDRRPDQGLYTCHEPRPLAAADMLEELVNILRATLIPAPAPAPASIYPMAIPASYMGDAAGCGGFLLQVSLFIEMQPQKFTTKRSKVAFLISLLARRSCGRKRSGMPRVSLTSMKLSPIIARIFLVLPEGCLCKINSCVTGE